MRIYTEQIFVLHTIKLIFYHIAGSRTSVPVVTYSVPYTPMASFKTLIIEQNENLTAYFHFPPIEKENFRLSLLEEHFCL